MAYSGKHIKNVEKKSRFWIYLLIYIAVFLAVTAAALSILWHRMDIYELSRPETAMEQWMKSRGGTIRSEMESMGIEKSFLDTIDFESVSYYKKLDEYSEQRPAFGIRLGGKTYITAFLSPDKELDYNSNTWKVDELKVIPSELCVFVPEGADITINGVSIIDNYTPEYDAQEVQLSDLEKNREDIHGLTKYSLLDIYGIDNLEVTDKNGVKLEPSVQNGFSYYYAPIESDYMITAPNVLIVSVNGNELNELNSEITSEKIEDFEGVENSLPFVPEIKHYLIRGLIEEPVVTANLSDGTVLPLTEKRNNEFIFELISNEEFEDEVSARIIEAFKAYVNFSGNKNKDFQTNLNNYLKYLVPNSEAANRARNARQSLIWVNGRDTTLGSSAISSVIPYSEDMFTAEINFTIKTAPEKTHSVLFVFVRYDNDWRIVRVLNK